MSDKPEYKRLPGRKGGFLGYKTLWMSEDHLLYVDSAGVRENYKRFYFEDIQAFIIRKTFWGKIHNTICILMILFFSRFWWKFSDTEALVFFCLFLLSPLVAILLYNLWAGPTCDCYIRTPVQTEHIKSLWRVRTAHKAIRKVLPKIEAAQGKLSPELLADGMTRAKSEKDSPLESSRSVFTPGLPHRILFSLLLAIAALTAIEIVANHVTLILAETLAGMGCIICIIMALVQQRDNRMPESLKILTWASGGYILISKIIGSAISVATALSHPQTIYNQWEFLRAASEMDITGNTLLLSAYIFSLAASLILGILGWLNIRR